MFRGKVCPCQHDLYIELHWLENKIPQKNSRWFELLSPTHWLSVPFIIPLSILTLELPLTWGIQLPYAYFLAPYNVAFAS